MERISCEIVRDLLESYEEQLVTDNTKKIIAEHLEGCEKCRKTEQEITQQMQLKRQQTESRDKKFRKKLISCRYEIFGFFTGVIIVLGLLLLKIVVENIAMELFW